jgi:hypothetical protein
MSHVTTAQTYHASSGSMVPMPSPRMPPTPIAPMPPRGWTGPRRQSLAERAGIGLDLFVEVGVESRGAQDPIDQLARSGCQREEFENLSWPGAATCFVCLAGPPDNNHAASFDRRRRRRHREAMLERLEQDSFRVRSCDSLASARGELETKSFDLVLLDVQLPDGNGLALLNDLEQQPGAEIVFITATAAWTRRSRRSAAAPSTT